MSVLNSCFLSRAETILPNYRWSLVKIVAIDYLAVKRANDICCIVDDHEFPAPALPPRLIGSPLLDPSSWRDFEACSRLHELAPVTSCNSSPFAMLITPVTLSSRPPRHDHSSEALRFVQTPLNNHNFVNFFVALRIRKHRWKDHSFIWT